MYVPLRSFFNIIIGLGMNRVTVLKVHKYSTYIHVCMSVLVFGLDHRDLTRSNDLT